MASVFKAAANQQMADEPFYLRYKGSILIIGSGLAWVLTQLATSEDIAELGWGSAFGVAASIIALLVNRFTKDGITPSMARRLEHAGAIAFQDRISESGIAAYAPAEDDAPRAIHVPLNPEPVAKPAPADAPPSDDLPVYYGESTAD